MKYIAFYDTVDYLYENRSFELSSVNVVEYIAGALSGAVGKIEIISPTRTKNKSGYFHGRTTCVSNSITLLQPPTFGVKTKVGRIFAILLVQLWLFIYLLFNTKKGENVIVYHSLSIMTIVKLIKSIKKIHLTLEIREIYTDINTSTQKQKIRELKYFSVADSYIFPTELLNRIINKKNKPYVIATGIYKSEEITEEKFNDGKIHIVYAGTFRVEKGGAMTSIGMSQYLNGDYHVHILGDAPPSVKNIALDAIQSVREKSNVTITYDGVLRGDDFNKFLQKCHIGLSTQNPVGDYNDSSFPSKILTYLANGLDVLSIKIPAVKTSPVGDYLYYYENNNFQEIANAIKSINIDNSKNKAILLNQLDSDLIENLKNLLSVKGA